MIIIPIANMVALSMNGEEVKPVWRRPFAPTLSSLYHHQHHYHPRTNYILILLLSESTSSSPPSFHMNIIFLFVLGCFNIYCSWVFQCLLLRYLNVYCFNILMFTAWYFDVSVAIFICFLVGSLNVYCCNISMLLLWCFNVYCCDVSMLLALLFFPNFLLAHQQSTCYCLTSKERENLNPDLLGLAPRRNNIELKIFMFSTLLIMIFPLALIKSDRF